MLRVARGFTPRPPGGPVLSGRFISLARPLSFCGLISALVAGCSPGREPGKSEAPPIPTLTLVDVTEAAGIDFALELPAQRPYNLLETIGHGAAFLDFDRDGWPDILLAGPAPRLYRNTREGRFLRVAAGLEALPKADYRGVAVGDYDRVGYPDVYLSAFRGGVLLRNDAGARFLDVSREAGVPAQRWGSAATFADLDGDGRLDLVIGNYLRYDTELSDLFCQHAGVIHSCEPWYYAAEKPQVLRNLGTRFEDVTAAWGFDQSEGKNLGVLAADLDGDGQLEVVFANDMVPGDLFARRARSGAAESTSGNGDKASSFYFENLGVLSGTAFDDKGAVHAGMGIDAGDLDRDGRLDLVVTAFYQQGAGLYLNQGRTLFRNAAFARGVGAATSPYVGFGVRFIDLDNDGWLDLVMANGHIYESARELFGTTSFEQPISLLYNTRGSFVNQGSRLTGRAATGLVGRGLATADYDRDGRIDVLVVDERGKPLLLRNETTPGGHWLRVRLADLEGRDLYGAVLEATSGGKTLIARYQSDGSFFSASDPRIHLGLGAAAKVDRLVVRWPSGRKEAFPEVPADGEVELREGTGTPLDK